MTYMLMMQLVAVLREQIAQPRVPAQAVQRPLGPQHQLHQQRALTQQQVQREVQAQPRHPPVLAGRAVVQQRRAGRLPGGLQQGGAGPQALAAALAAVVCPAA